MAIIARAILFPCLTALILSPPISSAKNSSLYQYRHRNRTYSGGEKALQLGSIYLLSWGTYPLFQSKAFKSKSRIRENFGKLTLDPDEPQWNLLIHPYSGAQLYLFYRALGYTRGGSLGMAATSSSLFEFLVEIHGQPASIQDLWHTPLLGSILGHSIENLSLQLLNSGNLWGKFFGHLINPSTLFWFYQGKVQIIPRWDGKKRGELTLVMDF